MRTDHYHNILVITPNGERLSTIDKKRKEFYLKNDLAIDNGECDGYPDSIVLKFQPDVESNREYQLTPKENRCVVCGQEHDLELHHVVPYCIVRNFDECYRKYRSHWCVLMCKKHHKQADAANEFFLKELQLAIKKFAQQKENKHLNSIYQIYKKGNWDKVPIERQQLLLHNAKLSNISEIQDYVPEPNFGKIFIDTWTKEWINRFDSIQELHEKFRDQFMTLNPHYLPKGYLIFDFDDDDR